jgi:hypothetical protein
VIHGVACLMPYSDNICMLTSLVDEATELKFMLQISKLELHQFIWKGLSWINN